MLCVRQILVSANIRVHIGYAKCMYDVEISGVKIHCGKASKKKKVKVHRLHVRLNHEIDRNIESTWNLLN